MKTDSLRHTSGVLAAGLSVVAAIASSACCWLPLLLLTLGLSGGTIAAAFDQWRPVLLPVTFALLGVAFYLTYRRPKSATEENCCRVPAEDTDPADCCSPDTPRRFTLRSLNRTMLWVATAFVLGFAFFPSYVGALLGNNPVESESELTSGTVHLGIDGMTCAGCETTVETALTRIPGVKSVNADFETGQAVVTLQRESRTTTTELIDAVLEVGYTAHVVSDTPIP